MTSHSLWLWTVALTGATWLPGCSGGGGGPLQVVFESGRNLDATSGYGSINIWLVRSDGKGLRPLTRATTFLANSRYPEWSPDGSKIVFVSPLDLNGADALNRWGTDNLWRVNADGTDLMPLTRLTAPYSETGSPQWSADGTAVAFHSNRELDGTDAVNHFGTVNIWLVNADGTNLRPVTSARAVQAHSFGPQWLPDGTKIVFGSYRKLDGTDVSAPVTNLWLVNADGTNLIPFTRTNNTSNFGPQWSPDGTKVLFTSTRALDATDTDTTEFNLWRMNADGTGLRPLTEYTALSSFVFTGRWAPDGSKIVFDHNVNVEAGDPTASNWKVWRINSDGGGLMAMTPYGRGAASPRWSHDGTKVVFVSGRTPPGGGLAIVKLLVVNADGTGPTPITTDDTWIGSPSFGP